MRRPSTTNIIAVFAALYVGVSFGNRAGPVTITETRVVAPSDYVSIKDALAEKNTQTAGLRSRIRGLEERTPAVVIQTDTVVMPPDTVFDVARVSAAGFLTISRLVKTDSIGYRPTILQDIDIRDCDDGYSIGRTVVCNKARLGHLFLFGTLPVEYSPLKSDFDPWAGVYWEPSNRSSWRFAAGYTVSGSFRVELSKGWRLF